MASIIKARRDTKVAIQPKKEEISFIAIDWFECDYEDQMDAEEKANYYNSNHNRKYTIFVFGVTQQGHSVCLRIKDYCPYFYINIPSDFTDQQAKDLQMYFHPENYDELDMEEFREEDNENLKTDMRANSYYIKSSIDSDNTKPEEKLIFWSFMNEQKFKFLKLAFISKYGHRFWSRYLSIPHNYPIKGRDRESIKFSQYESDLEPVLRFFHDRKIKPSSWIRVPAGQYDTTIGQSKCQINIECSWDQVFPEENNNIPPIVVASFDIEADSSHGDFPIPKKDTKKLANQLVISWLRDQRTIEKELDKNSIKYKKAAANLAKKRTFFADRVKQALRFPLFKDTDPDIDIIYMKEMQNVKDKIRHNPERLDNVCNTIYQICDHPIRKVKADMNMKKAMKSIEMEEEAKRKKLMEVDKRPFKLEDLDKIIESTAKKYHIPVKELHDKVITKEVMVKFVTQELNYFLGEVEGDPVIQIGTVFWRYGDPQPFHNNIITLDTCNKFKVGDLPCEVISKEKEIDVLLEWSNLIAKYDPDIIIGYNTFGFDESFMYDRMLDLVKYHDYNSAYQNSPDFKSFVNMTRLHDALLEGIREARGCLMNKKLSSSALGDNFLSYFNMPGRVQIDLLKVCQSSLTKLPSYKLDEVASFYLSGKIKKIIADKTEYPDAEQSRFIYVDNLKEIQVGNYIVINMSTTGQKLYDGDKLLVKSIDEELKKVELDKPVVCDCLMNAPVWGLAKDDISPMEIFEFQKKGPADRAKIAKYCIQDCALLIRLLKKLDTIPNNFGMSNVCLVPFSYIFMRGQGIKIFSLMVNECAMQNYVLPVLEKRYLEEGKGTSEDDEVVLGENEHRSLYDKKNPRNAAENEDDDEDENPPTFSLQNDFNVIIMTEDSYEGAIVLKPRPDIYTDPITVLDFGSLYPSEMIASDLSHDRLCEDPYWLGEEGAKRLEKLGLSYLDRSYDNYTWIDPANKNKGKKKDGVTTVRYVQYPDGKKGLVPQILQKLLKARKATKKQAEAESDPFKASILDGLQLAYKVTANSLYGQIGAKTSKVYKPAIAASTTAGGRGRIMHAKDFVLKHYTGSEIVYGDTDSIFIKFNLSRPDGTKPEGREAIEMAIKMGMEAEAAIQPELPKPHVLEYEKVFYPFILITKKRYIGIKYEHNPEEGKKTSMGVVTKRRDNAPILKHTFIGVVDTLMKERNIPKSIKFVQETCREMVDNKYDLNMFVISKTLNSYYKDPEAIAHRVLADRMAERDPGNKPAVNERIPYVYIKIEEVPGVDYLQGDRIEHVNYVRSNKCKVDYETYITNQIMKPVSQIFELVVEKLPGFPYHKNYFKELEVDLYNEFNGDLSKVAEKISKKKLALVKKLIFDEMINYANQKANNIATIDKWFTETKASSSNFSNVNSTDSVNSSTNTTNTTDQPKVDSTKPKIKKLKQSSINDWFN